MTEQRWIEPFSASGEWVSLVPLEIGHAPDLIESVKDGNLSDIWYARVPSPDAMEAEIKRRLRLAEEGAMVSFTVLDSGARVIGMTNYMTVDPYNRRVEIGYTWYRKSVQRTPVNTEAKLILLSHAFEEANCIAVGFTTSSFNTASRKAIERLGAKLDGVLRNDCILPDGTVRDTCYYSITDGEWPAVKRHLRWLLSNDDRS